MLVPLGGWFLTGLLAKNFSLGLSGLYWPVWPMKFFSGHYWPLQIFSGLYWHAEFVSGTFWAVKGAGGCWTVV